MTKTILHKIKLMIANVRWFFYIVGIIAIHKKHIKTFKFIFDIQKNIKYAILKEERESEVITTEKERLYAQKQIVDKIISIIIEK